MRVLHETIQQDSSASLSIRDFDLKAFDCPYHCHPEFEILRIDQSEGRVLVGDYSGDFRAGEIYVFGGLLPHAFINSKSTVRARSRCLQFDAERFQGVVDSFPEMRSMGSLVERAARGLLLKGEVALRASGLLDQLDDDRGVFQIALVLQLLHEIQSAELTQSLASEGYCLRRQDYRITELERVLTYIHENSAEALNVGTLAQLAGMSETSFYRHFRQRIGRTPSAYIQDLRLSNVARRLMESDDLISEIAFSEGFNNLSNFNAQFQRSFRLSPREYRCQHDGESE